MATPSQQFSAASDQRDAYTIDEGARRMSIGRTAIYALAKRGDIRLIKIGGRTLVPRSEIERLTSVK